MRKPWELLPGAIKLRKIYKITFMFFFILLFFLIIFFLLFLLCCVVIIFIIIISCMVNVLHDVTWCCYTLNFVVVKKKIRSCYAHDFLIVGTCDRMQHLLNWSLFNTLASIDIKEGIISSAFSSSFYLLISLVVLIVLIWLCVLFLLFIYYYYYYYYCCYIHHPSS